MPSLLGDAWCRSPVPWASTARRHAAGNSPPVQRPRPHGLADRFRRAGTTAPVAAPLP